MDKIQILIVDDHPMMRDALLTALAEEKDMTVIGQAYNGLEGTKLAAELKPDIILMDLLMPGMDGLSAITEIMKTMPEAKILVVTSLEDEDKILAAIQAGALGYFPKTAPRPYLLEAIRRIADGIPYLPSGIALKLFNSIRSRKPLKTGDVEGEQVLTARQQEILALLGEGR